MGKSILKIGILTAIILSGTIRSICQSNLPEVFEQGTISDQINYIEERTRIYENYRAIREDMFQMINRNTIDTLNDSRFRIQNLLLQTTMLDNRIDSLTERLEASNNELKEMTRTKNSIRVLGMEIRKTPYNSVMWIIIAVLIFLVITGYLSFKQNRMVTLRTKKDLNELKEEFEAYRTEKRLEREKTAMNHFNEVKKLKGR